MSCLPELNAWPCMRNVQEIQLNINIIIQLYNYVRDMYHL